MPASKVGSANDYLRQLLLQARQAQLSGGQSTSEQADAVKSFQRSNSLKPDGVIGPKTNKILERYLSDGFDTSTTAQTAAGTAGASAVAQKSAARPTLDVDKAIATLDADAGTKSKHKCATYVRKALEAGGLNTNGHPEDAKDYGPFLKSKGFTKVDTSKGYTPQKGDVAVMPANDASSAGHVCMYDGNKWVSDFKQNEMLPGKAYRASGQYAIYRP